MKYVYTLIFIVLLHQGYSQCIEGDCVNGYGKYTCDCGYLFEGIFENGERITGTLTKENLVYTGEFKFDLAHGFGRIMYKDSSWYEGLFVENVMEGYGTFCFPDGQKYIGELINGSFEGLGIQFIPTKDSLLNKIEIGHFNNDLLNGWGGEISTVKEIYVGNYKDGIKQGIGIYLSIKGAPEFGVYKKGKLLRNEIELHKLNPADIRVTNFMFNHHSYNLSAKLGDKIKLEEHKNGALKRVVILDEKNQYFFVSSKETPYSGRIITFEGLIFQASIQENMNVVKGKPLYLR